MSKILPIAVGCLLIVVCTFVQGSWTQRWSTAPEKHLDDVASRYEKIPIQIGPWVGKDQASSTRILQRAGARASISRTYTNQETGEMVSVFVICGYSRDIAVHTPDACYVNSGFQMETRPVGHTVRSGGNSARMFTSTFLKESRDATVHQRIFWSWTTDGNWEAPESPRWKYGGRSVLNKVYLISNLPPTRGEQPGESSAHKFGELFLATLAKTLYPPEPAKSADVADSSGS